MTADEYDRSMIRVSACSLQDQITHTVCVTNDVCKQCHDAMGLGSEHKTMAPNISS